MDLFRECTIEADGLGWWSIDSAEENLIRRRADYYGKEIYVGNG